MYYPWLRYPSRFAADNRLLRQVALAKLQGPNATDLEFLKRWFERPSMGAFPIRGLDMLAWDDESDLVAIKPRATPDLLSKWLINIVFPFLHRTLGQHIKVTQSFIIFSCRLCRCTVFAANPTTARHPSHQSWVMASSSTKSHS